MTTSHFSVDPASLGTLSQLYDVGSARCARNVDAQGRMEGDVVVADGIQIVRAKNIPSATFVNRPGVRPGRSAYMLVVASQAQAVELPSTTLRWHGANELIVLNTGQPWQIRVPKTRLSTVMTVDKELFDQVRSADGSDAAVPWRHSVYLKTLVCAVMDSAWSLAKAGELAIAAPRLLRSLLDAFWLSAATAARDEERLPKSAALVVRRDQVKAYMHAHYAEPDLSVESIAQTLGVSARYIRLAFAETDLSPSRYLYDYRLDVCAQRLADAAHSTRSITEIALASGFNSAAHFSDGFKQRFGRSPRDFRMQATRACG